MQEQVIHLPLLQNTIKLFYAKTISVLFYTILVQNKISVEKVKLFFLHDFYISYSVDRIDMKQKRP